MQFPFLALALLSPPAHEGLFYQATFSGRQFPRIKHSSTGMDC